MKNLKIALIGTYHSGATSLLLQWGHKIFFSDTFLITATTGYKTYEKEQVRVAASEYPQLSGLSTLHRHVHVVIVVLDMMKPERDLIDEIKAYMYQIGQGVPVVYVGTKSDLVKNARANLDCLFEACGLTNPASVIVSAKTRDGVDEAFDMAKAMVSIDALPDLVSFTNTTLFSKPTQQDDARSTGLRTATTASI